MKQIIPNYTFSTSAKTITLTDFTTIRLDRIQLIVDVTTNKILYNFADSSIATATVATNVITLSALQGGENNADKLQIVYDCLTGDPSYDTGLSGGGATKSYTFTTSSAGAQNLLSDTDCRGFAWIEIVFSSVGSGLALTAQFATAAGGTYNNSSSFSSSPSTAPNSALGTTANTVYAGPVRGDFFRLAVSALTSGTFAGTVTLRAIPPNGVAAAILSASATGASVPSVAHLIGVQGNSSLLQTIRTAANAGTNTGNDFVIAIANYMYNGSTYDVVRNNLTFTTGDTGAKTSSFAGATQTNYNARGAYITILLGTVTGTTPTFSAQLQWSPDGGTTWLNLGPALADLTTSNQKGVIMVYPTNLSQAAGATPANLTTGGDQTLALNAPLPRTWRLNVTIAGTSPSFSLSSVNVNYVP